MSDGRAAIVVYVWGRLLPKEPANEQTSIPQVQSHSQGEMERVHEPRLIFAHWYQALVDNQRPARTPLSTSAFFTHSLSDCAVQPIFAVIEDTVAQRERCSLS